mmetsp:Transcript_42146/g.92394  ORF Transcript_42146/g.92394 Transcript_42146/m.92394 type:complete len:82 (-) Transcript_42146:158-403(-)
MSYFDAMNSALGVILVIIGLKLILEAAGIEVPLWVFAGSLTAFRAALGIRAGVKYYFTRRSRINAGIGGTERSLDEGDEAS